MRSSRRHSTEGWSTGCMCGTEGLEVGKELHLYLSAAEQINAVYRKGQCEDGAV